MHISVAMDSPTKIENTTVSPFYDGGSTTAPENVVDKESDDDRTHSSVYQAGFNFVNSIVGAGIIGMPVAIKECGLFMGILLLLMVAALIHRSTIMLIECGIVAKKYNLEELMRHLFGVHGYNITTFAMFLFAYGAMIAYMVIIGDTVPIALDYFIGGESPGRTVILLLTGCCVILPLSLLRDMSSLSSTSALSIFADFLMIIFICSRGSAAAKSEDTSFNYPEDLTFISSNLFEGIGTISFAFVCQHSSFIVYRSMKDRSLGNWTLIANYCLGVAFVMCLTLGLVGYLTFGSNVNGDIMTNFPDNDELILASRLLLASTMVFTYPMECFVTRHALISLIYNYFESKNADRAVDRSTQNGVELDAFGANAGGPVMPRSVPPLAGSTVPPLSNIHGGGGDGNNHSDALPSDMRPSSMNEEYVVNDGEVHHISLMQHVTVTLLLWGSSLAIAIASSDLRIVLALTGCLAASMIGYIIPAVTYIKTYEADFKLMLNKLDSRSNAYEPVFTNRVTSIGKFGVPLFMLFFGVVALLAGLGSVFYDIGSD